MTLDRHAACLAVAAAVAGAMVGASNAETKASCGAAAADACSSPASARVMIGSFAIDRTEVTIGQFRSFLRARNARTTAEADGGGFEFVGGWTRRVGWT